MVAKFALVPYGRPTADSRICLFLLPLAAAVILGLLFMHVLAMLPSEQGMSDNDVGAVTTTLERGIGHGDAGAVTATEAATSMQNAADHGVHAGGTCLSSSPQALAIAVPGDVPDLTPAAPQPQAPRPDPMGQAPDLFTLCVLLN